MIPTHTTKGDKRYRYYVTQPGCVEKKRLCLPAHDVERIATEQWLQLLSADDLDIQLDIEDPTLSASLRASAERLVKRWKSMDSLEQREILLQVNVQVPVNDRRIELSTEPVRLSSLLVKTSKLLDLKETPRKAARVIRAVDTAFIKAAGETRILAEELSAIAAAITPGHKTLLRAISQGRAWAEALVAGEVTSAEEITAKTGLSAAPPRCIPRKVALLPAAFV